MCYKETREEGRQIIMRGMWRNPYAGRRPRGPPPPPAPIPGTWPMRHHRPRNPWPMRFHGPREPWPAPDEAGTIRPPRPPYRHYAPRPRAGFYFDGRSPFYFHRRQEEQRRVKRCLNCNHFSNFNPSVRSCSNCGHELRESAKLFRDPLVVNAVFRAALEEVSRDQLGPDFLPLLPPTDEVLESINHSSVLSEIPRSSNSTSQTVVRITSEGPVTAILPQPTITEAVGAVIPEVCTSASMDTGHNQNSDSTSSSEVVEIISPPHPLIEKKREAAKGTISFENTNQPSCSATTASKNTSKRVSKSKSPNVKLIFVLSDDEDEAVENSNTSSKSSPPKESAESPNAVLSESATELQASTVDRNKSRKKSSKPTDAGKSGDKNHAPSATDELQPVESQQLENEPALTLGTAEEPQQGFVWEGVTYNSGASLIHGAPVLGPDGKPTRSELCGGEQYVWQCPQCSSYRDELDKCGACKKKLTKKTPITPLSTLTEEQLEGSKRLERKYIQDKIEEKVNKFKLAQYEKAGLFNDIASVKSATPPADDSNNSSSNENETVRKRKSAPQEEHGLALPAFKKTKSGKRPS